MGAGPGNSWIGTFVAFTRIGILLSQIDFEPGGRLDRARRENRLLDDARGRRLSHLAIMVTRRGNARPSLDTERPITDLRLPPQERGLKRGRDARRLTRQHIEATKLDIRAILKSKILRSPERGARPAHGVTGRCGVTEDLSQLRSRRHENVLDLGVIVKCRGAELAADTRLLKATERGGDANRSVGVDR